MLHQPFIKHGFIPIPRRITEHPVFKPEPFTEIQAFLWLWEQAVFTPTEMHHNGKIMILKRGQCCFSLRFLANRWQWKKDRVRLFLKRLARSHLIQHEHVLYTTASGTKQKSSITLITICDYEIMLETLHPKSSPRKKQNATDTRQQRDTDATKKKEGKKTNKEKKSYTPYHQFIVDREQIYRHAFEEVFLEKNEAKEVT